MTACGQSEPPAKGEAGPPGPPGPPGPSGGNGRAIRVIAAPCDQTTCGASCDENEQILNDYSLNPGRAIVRFAFSSRHMRCKTACPLYPNSDHHSKRKDRLAARADFWVERASRPPHRLAVMLRGINFSDSLLCFASRTLVNKIKQFIAAAFKMCCPHRHLRKGASGA